MKNNKLQLNADKTEYLIVASPNVLPKITLRSTKISGMKIEPSVSANNLGVMFDKHLNMCEHVDQICRKAQFLLKKIGDIRNCSSIVTTEHLIHAYVTSQLDCCNSVLYVLPKSCVLKLQRIQNSAARIKYRRKKKEKKRKKHMGIDHLIKLPLYFGTNYHITYEAVTNLINLSDT